MCQCKFSCVFSAILCLSVYPVTAFNVDSFNYAAYETPFRGGANAMFGFSLALHKERNNGWLLVGAPEAQSSQPGVIRGGVVYKCPTYQDGGCQEIPFDPNSHNIDKNSNLMDNKTEQWFGATVSTTGRTEGPVVACAPRYTWFPRSSRRDPVGTCYTSNGVFTEFNEYSPCRTYQWGYHRQGSCQAGFSAAITAAGDLFIGSPGSWYWQGQMYSIDANTTFKYKPANFSETYGHPGQIHRQSLADRPAVFATNEGTEEDDDSYMGYSTITGDFLGNGQQGIAVGMPRGNNLKGKVLLFTWNLTNFMQNFTSDQIGSYYGYALAASDVDGDKKLDLIVGAPMYTVQNNEDKYDVGRVYVIYHQSDMGIYASTYIIDGFNSKSRFGQALASLGDINQDGYGDFAVGAPYDGTNNRGAVYIYHGSSKGVRSKFSQVILAEDVIPLPTGALTTFGFALTGGLDLDDNEYPDMAVGAYLSNKAFFFRSRPVIKVEAYVKFLSRAVDIENSDHFLQNGKEATKTQIQFCSKYYGKGIPSTLNLGVEYILDTKKPLNPRMGFVDDEGQNRKNTTILLEKDQQMKCGREVDVYVRRDIRDKLTALVVEAKYWLREDADLTPSYLDKLPRNPRATLFPVLDLNSPPSKKDSIIIQKNCGNDNVCIPNLVLTVEPSVREYSLDSGEQFYLEIIVSNSAEDAFETTLEVQYPDGFYFSTASDVQVLSHVLCSSLENNTITCDIGNPVPHNSVVHFKLFWQPDLTKELSSKLRFNVTVNSTNEEDFETRHDNNKVVEISIHYDIIEEIKGWSVPPERVFSPATSLYVEDISNQTRHTLSKDRLTEDKIGPQIIHVYTLTNKGQTTINETEIFFVWPALTATDDDFFYLVEPPDFLNTENLNLKCGAIPHNHRDFTITRRKSIWDLVPRSVLPQYETPPTADKVEFSHQTNASVGGGFRKSDEEIDRAVDQGDTSGVKGLRTQKATSRIQIFEEGSQTVDSANFKRLQFGGKNYVYRCVRTVNGIEEELECGSEISLGNIPGLLKSHAQYQEFGDVQYWCLEQDSNGNWKNVPCGVTQKSDTTVQIFHGGQEISSQLGSGKYQHQKIDGSDFVYRCFRRRNGQKEEIDCGKNFKFSSVDIPWVLQNAGQQEGNIRYACLQPDSKGNLQRTTCQGVPKIKITTEFFSNGTNQWNNTVVNPQKGDIRVQILEADEGLRRQLGGTFTKKVIDGRTFVYRCYRRRFGVEQEVDCGQNLAFSSIDLTRILQNSGVQEGDIRYACLQVDTDGKLHRSTCQNVPKIQIQTEIITWGENSTHYWNNSGVYSLRQKKDVKVQILEGGADLRRELEGSFSQKIINGRGFIYRCFKYRYGSAQEVDCGSDLTFSSIDISWALENSGMVEDGIRYCCLEEDTRGKLRSTSCAGIPKVVRRRPTVSRVQVLMGSEETRRQLEGGLYRHQVIDGRDIIYRCFRSRNGRDEEIDCGENFSMARINIATLLERAGLQQGQIRYTCLEPVGGTFRQVDCGGLPQIKFKTEVLTTYWRRNATHYWNNTGVYKLDVHYDFETVQVLQGGAQIMQQLVGSYRFETVEGQDFLYRCFRDTEQVDCGPIFSLAGINILVVMRRVAMQKISDISYFCVEMDVSGDWRGGDCSALPSIQTRTHQPIVTSTEILRRCLRLVNGAWTDVDCSSDVRFQGSSGGTFVEQCFQTVNGQRENIDCKSLSPGTIFKDAFTGRSQTIPASSGNTYDEGTYEEGSYEDDYEYTAPQETPQGSRRDPHTYGTYGNSRSGGVSNGIGGAAQGSGFTTGVLDLGTLGGQSGSHWSESRHLPPVYNNIGDNVPTAAPSPKNWHHGRRKRQIIVDNHPSIVEIQKQYPCKNLKCVYMRCTLNNLKHDKPVVVALRGRLNAKVLRSMKLENGMKFSSMMLARVQKVPHLRSVEDSTIAVQEVETTITTQPEIKSETVPLWVVVLSAVAGTIILLLIIFLLYKLGFFKRNRPSSAPERQPLNRNGYHHGDEAL